MLFLLNPYLYALVLFLISLLPMYWIPSDFLYKFYFVIPTLIVGIAIGAGYVEFRYKKAGNFGFTGDSFPNIFFWLFIGGWLVYLGYFPLENKSVFFTLWVFPISIGMGIGAAHNHKHLAVKLYILCDKPAHKEYALIKKYKNGFIYFNVLYWIPTIITMLLMFSPFYISFIYHSTIFDIFGHWWILIMIILMIFFSLPFTAWDDFYREYLVSKLFPKSKLTFKEVSDMVGRYNGMSSGYALGGVQL